MWPAPAASASLAAADIEMVRRCNDQHWTIAAACLHRVRVAMTGDAGTGRPLRGSSVVILFSQKLLSASYRAARVNFDVAFRCHHATCLIAEPSCTSRLFLVILQ